MAYGYAIPALYKGWNKSGGVVSLAAATDKVGIGTTAPGAKMVVTDGTGGTVTARPDAMIEMKGVNPLVSLFQTTNPGTTVDETAIAFMGFDDAGGIKKTASISSKWGNADDAVGYGTLRLNVTYAGGLDKVQIKLFGGGGVRINAGDGITPPGDGVLSVEGLGMALPTGATFSQGTVAPDVQYGIQGLHNGVQLSGSNFVAHRFVDAAASRGVLLGYDNGGQPLATITSQGGNSGIAFWTHNGSAWGARLTINTIGNVQIAGMPTAAAGLASGTLWNNLGVVNVAP